MTLCPRVVPQGGTPGSPGRDCGEFERTPHPSRSGLRMRRQRATLSPREKATRQRRHKRNPRHLRGERVPEVRGRVRGIFTPERQVARTSLLDVRGCFRAQEWSRRAGPTAPRGKIAGSAAP